MTWIAQALWIPCLTTVVLMFALRPVARSVGLVDKPGGRKTHEGHVPVVGGLAMLAGVMVGLLSDHQSSIEQGYLIASLLTLVLVGAVDDRYDLPAAVRFLAQILATLLMIYGANRYVGHIGHAFFGGVVELGVFSVPFTLLIVLTAINAFNMFDGSDGVAGAQALIGLVFLSLAALLSGSTVEMAIALSLMGSVLGFLLFNWPSKRTKNMRAFMGDAGSTMLGFTLAWLSVGLSQGDEAVISPVVTLWIFALPIYDLFSSMIRRILQGKSPFHADSEHLHHLLKRLGLNSRRVAQFVLLISALFAAVGFGGHFWGVPDGLLFLLWLLLGVAYFVVFASGAVVKRRAHPRPIKPSDTGSHEMWKQHD